MEPYATTVAQYQLRFAPALRKAPSLLASIPDRTTWVSHMLEQASATSDTFLHAATSAPNTLPQLPPAPHVSYNHFPTTMDPVRTQTNPATARSCTKASRADSHCFPLGSHQSSETHFAATARRTPPHRWRDGHLVACCMIIPLGPSGGWSQSSSFQHPHARGKVGRDYAERDKRKRKTTRRASC